MSMKSPVLCAFNCALKGVTSSQTRPPLIVLRIAFFVKAQPTSWFTIRMVIKGTVGSGVVVAVAVGVADAVVVVAVGVGLPESLIVTVPLPLPVHAARIRTSSNSAAAE